MNYPAFEKNYSEQDVIIGNNKEKIGYVIDYWKWAHANLIDNAERGIFAEYLVAKAVGDKRELRENWARYDVISEEGITAEVKTSAYIQTWWQDKLSDIRFGISETIGYSKETNSYEDESRRQAQVYVFCVHNEKEQEKIDIVNMQQWDFYVLSSKILNNDKNYSKSKIISLNPLIKLGAKKCKYDEIH